MFEHFMKIQKQKKSKSRRKNFPNAIPVPFFKKKVIEKNY
jgi:hypothetical protein